MKKWYTCLLRHKINIQKAKKKRPLFCEKKLNLLFSDPRREKRRKKKQPFGKGKIRAFSWGKTSLLVLATKGMEEKREHFSAIQKIGRFFSLHYLAQHGTHWPKKSRPKNHHFLRTEEIPPFSPALSSLRAFPPNVALNHPFLKLKKGKYTWAGWEKMLYLYLLLPIFCAYFLSAPGNPIGREKR